MDAEKTSFLLEATCTLEVVEPHVPISAEGFWRTIDGSMERSDSTDAPRVVPTGSTNEA